MAVPSRLPEWSLWRRTKAAVVFGPGGEPVTLTFSMEVAGALFLSVSEFYKRPTRPKRSSALQYPQVMRQLGKTLALIAMMASVINAQCAMSCSLQTFGNSAAAESKPALVHAETHACCPRHDSNSQQAPGNTCPRPTSHSDEVRLETNGTAFVLAAGVDLPMSTESIAIAAPQFRFIRAEVRAAVNWSAQSAPALNPVRRI
jgi:hypothetical protein